jgi:hypothetical protein
MALDPAAKRERAKRLATDYSASQNERDNQDRARGHQRRGAIAEGAEKMSRGSLDRETERVDRPPLSETTEVDPKLHSSNSNNRAERPTTTRLEMLKNRSQR